jgi:hypothetical protein
MGVPRPKRVLKIMFYFPLVIGRFVYFFNQGLSICLFWTPVDAFIKPTSIEDLSLHMH